MWEFLRYALRTVFYQESYNNSATKIFCHIYFFNRGHFQQIVKGPGHV